MNSVLIVRDHSLTVRVCITMDNKVFSHFFSPPDTENTSEIVYIFSPNDTQFCDDVGVMEAVNSNADTQFIQAPSEANFNTDAVSKNKNISHTRPDLNQIWVHEDMELEMYELAAAIEAKKIVSHIQPDLNQTCVDEDMELGMCELAAMIEEEEINPHTQVGGSRKRKATDDQPTASTANAAAEHNQTKIRNCDICDKMVSEKFFSNHLRSTLHKNNIIVRKHSLSNVTVMDTAFGSRIVTYKIVSPVTEKSILQTPETFFYSVKDTISSLINDCLTELTIVKINFIIHAQFIQETKNIHNTFVFQTLNYTVALGDDLDWYFNNLKETIQTKMSEFEQKDSGWTLETIKYLELNVNKFDPMRGSSYICLPQDIQLKKAVINVKNNDHECLKWALLSAIYPANTHVDRVSSYFQYRNSLRFDNVPFPVTLKNICKVESLNNISINVFGLEYDKNKKCNTIVGPLYYTKSRQETHINLLYISNDSHPSGHYCYIKNLSRLVSSQINYRNGALFICDGCLLYFTSQLKLEEHLSQGDCNHIVTELPSDRKKLKNWFGDDVPSDKISFEKFQRKLKIPFVIYADFEAFLKPLESIDPDPTQSFTRNVQKHEVYSYGYYIKCGYDDSLSRYKTYTGADCTKHFIENIVKDAGEINKKNCFQKRPLELNDEQTEAVQKTSTCHICSKNIDDEKVVDFDWNTGHFRGVAHSYCSSKFRAPKFILIFLHNLCNYDAHFIVHALNIVDGDINLIPQNKEKYISFSKNVFINGHQVELRFLDSFKFMSSSLDSLAKNLQPHQFRELKKEIPNEQDFDRLTRKGVFPYEFVTSHKSLEVTSLPKQKEFYSSLTECDITNEDYAHAEDVWTHFKCQNMLDYSNLYLKTDVLLLADIFENFRDVCIKTYDLDPAHYFTAPGLSWDAMLKQTKIQLDLLTDMSKLAFIKSSTRGGVSQCSNRHAKANNKYMHDYNPNERESYLAYFDANNLYGWAMSQYLPYGSFEWVDPTVDFNIPDTSNIGYILEVDLECPHHLHDLHSDLPLCPESKSIGGSKQPKLVPNLFDKVKYITHYRNLKQCVAMGMKIKKIHRVLKFNQAPWLQKYIELNTHHRTLATTDFEKDFFKLMNNAVFGKTMENIEKRVNVKLITHWENRDKKKGVQSYVARPAFHSLTIFSESLVAVQSKKTKLLYNKPIYLGFCILEISKTLMHDFHYNYIKTKFSNNVKLLYTDTDSLIYQFFTEDLYKDIKPDLSKYFDTSEFALDNQFGFPIINKKKIGYFKDENNGRIFREFVGLGSKIYAMDVEINVTAKAKGINKHTTKKFKMDDYRKCLLEKKNQSAQMTRFKSIKHIIYTQRINKISLSYNDTKRYLLPNCTDTLAWGHFRIPRN